MITPSSGDMYDHAIRGQLLAALRSPEEWEYEFNGRSKGNTRRREWLILESPEGEPLGYVQYLLYRTAQQNKEKQITSYFSDTILVGTVAEWP